MPELSEAEMAVLATHAERAGLAHEGEAEIARRRPQMVFVLDLSRAVADELTHVVNLLEERLVEIVRPAADDDRVRPALADAGELVVMPREFLHVAEQIQGNNDRILDLLARLEV